MSGIDSYTKLLLHFSGADGDTTFFDSSPSNLTISTFGNAQVDTDISKFGPTLLLDGVGDYVSAPDSDSWNFGSSDFTVDLWSYWSTDPNTASGGLAGQAVDTNNRILFGATSAAGLARLTFTSLTGGSVVANYTFDISLSISTWYHIAWVRSGSTVYLFLNGTSQSLTVGTAITTLPDLAATFDVGRAFFNGAQQYFTGNIEEFRVSRVARWTSNFTPPDREYSPSIVQRVIRPRVFAPGIAK